MNPSIKSALDDLTAAIQDDLLVGILSNLNRGNSVTLKLPTRSKALMPLNGTKPRPKPSRAKGEKRSPADLQKLTTSLASHIFRNPGQRIEQISKATGVPTKDLALPAKKLIAEKSVKTRGQKRATTYHPGSKAAS